MTPKTLLTLIFVLVALLPLAYTQELLNNIIKFGSREARETYIQLLQRQDPEVQVIRLDNIFTGLITVHSSIDAFNNEKQRLNRMFVSGPGLAILGFERDQVMSIAQQMRQSNPAWHLDRIDQRSLPLNGLFRFTRAPTRVNAYIVDTGIRVSHNEFEGRARPAFSAVPGLRAGQDCAGHGTHVAGLVGGRTYGVDKTVTLWDVRVLGCNGQGATSGILRALDWIARNARRPAVVNMSLGGGFSQSLNDGVDALARAGILPIVAAGNENANACYKSPASSSGALTVGASTSGDSRSSFSNYGRCVDIYAPGSSILSAGIRSDSSLARMSGTSMASPVTAGIAAAILSSNPNLSAGQLKAQIRSQASTNVRSSIRPFAYLPPTLSVRECPTGYAGPNCETPLCYQVPADAENVCSGHGRCISPNRCVCRRGYSGPTCGERRRPPQPAQPGEEPGEPQQPGEPGAQPGTGRIVALISGAPVRTITASPGATLTLDASVSHLSQSYQEELCRAQGGTSSVAGGPGGDAGEYSEWIPVVATLGYSESLSAGDAERQVSAIRRLWNPPGEESTSNVESEVLADRRAGGTGGTGAGENAEAAGGESANAGSNIEAEQPAGGESGNAGGNAEGEQPAGGENANVNAGGNAAEGANAGGNAENANNAANEGGNAENAGANQPAGGENANAGGNAEGANNAGGTPAEGAAGNEEVPAGENQEGEQPSGEGSNNRGEQPRGGGDNRGEQPSGGAGGTAESQLSFFWSCSADLTNSAEDPFCSQTQFDQEAKLVLSNAHLKQMQGLGPVLFTVQVQHENYVSSAQAVVEVQ